MSDENFKLLATGIYVNDLLNSLGQIEFLYDEIIPPNISLHKGNAKTVVVQGKVDLKYYGAPMEYFNYHFRAKEILGEVYTTVEKIATEFIDVEELGVTGVSCLMPGKSLPMHLDTQYEPSTVYINRFKRFHLVLQTNEQCWMVVEKEKKHFAKGELWFFNNRKMHCAINYGSTERIHLIIDAASRRY